MPSQKMYWKTLSNIEIQGNKKNLPKNAY